MILEEIDVHPCLLSEAVEVQLVELDNCQLLIPVKNTAHGVQAKRKVEQFFGVKNESSNQ